MRLRPSHAALAAAGFIAAELALPASVGAQPPNPLPETVVVYAQRRSSRLEKTPVTVSVISGAVVERRGLRELRQLRASVPGLTLSEAPGGLPQVSVRGVGTSAGNQLFEQSVGLFLDGVYQPRARQYRDALFDLSQVEIIKGTQGVLFGKNTSVGAITVGSKDPGRVLGGYVASDYETSFGSYTGQAAVDLPLSDRVRFRLAGLYQDEGGYVHNVTLNRDEGEDRRWVIRGTGVFDITSDLTATLKMQASHVQTVGDAFEFVRSSRPDLLRSYGVADGGSIPFVKYESSAPYGEAFDRQDSYAPSLRLNWTLPDGATLTSISGYSAYRFADGLDSDASPGPAPIVFTRFGEGFSQETEELRYASPSEQRFTYQAGLYVLHQHDHFTYENTFKNFYLLPTINALNVSGISQQDFTQSDNEVSGFVQGDYKLTDKVKLTVGGRLSQENKRGTYTKAITSDLGVADSVLGLISPLPAHPIEAALDNMSLDGAAILSVQAAPDTLLYASAGRGTKSGAFNNTAAFGKTGPDPFTVPPEKTVSFEAGIKQTALGGRLFGSLAIYHMHIAAYQDSYYSTAALGFLVRSINADTTGVEAEGRYQINQAFSVFGNLSSEPQANSTSGERLQRAPRFTGTIGGSWQHPITDAWRLSANGQLQYSSSFLTESAIAPGLNASGDYALLDLQVTLLNMPHGLEFSLRADNLLDRRYVEFSYGSLLSTAYLPGQGGEPLGSVGIYNRPRTFTLGVKKSF